MTDTSTAGWLTADLSSLDAARPDAIRAVAAVSRSAAGRDREALQGLAHQAPELAVAWQDSGGAAAAQDAVRRAADQLLDTIGALDFAARLLADFAERLDTWRSRAQDLTAQGESTAAALASVDRQRVGPAGSTMGGDFKVGRLLNAIHRDNADLSAINRSLAALSAGAASEATRAAHDLRAVQTTLDRWNLAVGAMPGSAAYRQFLTAWSDPAGRSIPEHPHAAAVWWAGLNAAQRRALLDSDPRAIGNANGLPADTRDQANRVALQQDLRAARAAAAAAGLALPDPGTDPSTDSSRISAALAAAGYSPAQSDAIRGALAVDYQLRRVAADFPPGTPVPAAQLLIYDPRAFDGRGRAAIALGSVSTAKNVAVCVAGMTSQVPDYLDNQVANAAALYSAAHHQDPAGTAVIAYLGYRAPDVDLGVTDGTDAEQGARWVANDLAGFAALRTGGPAFTTVIGHSYGSATVATAFVDHHPPADQVVLLGSPGAGRARQAADLGLPAGRVLVGSCSSDPVTTKVQAMQDSGGAITQGAATGAELGWKYGAGFNGDPGSDALIGGAAGLVAGVLGSQTLAPDLGVDPADRSFGAVRFRAETGDKDLTDFANHSQYYRPGSESLGNLAAAVTDHPERLTIAPLRSDPHGHWLDTADDPEYERP